MYRLVKAIVDDCEVGWIDAPPILTQMMDDILSPQFTEDRLHHFPMSYYLKTIDSQFAVPLAKPRAVPLPASRITYWDV